VRFDGQVEIVVNGGFEKYRFEIRQFIFLIIVRSFPQRFGHM
jgi:hypothetical protein